MSTIFSPVMCLHEGLTYLGTVIRHHQTNMICNNLPVNRIKLQPNLFSGRWYV